MARKSTASVGGSTTRSAVTAQPRRKRRVRAESAATVNRILDAGLDVLIHHGYSEFTLRRVAQAAHITHGNLAYHFPSKRELARALIARQVEVYSGKSESMLARQDSATELDVPDLIRWMLSDSVALRTMHIAREFWAMALHDPVIRRAVDDFYDDVMDRVVKVLHEACPAADMRSLREFVTLITVLSEGSGVVFGTRQERTLSHEQFLELSARLARSVIPELTPRPSTRPVRP